VAPVVVTPPTAQWRAPSSWKEQPASGLRLASFLASNDAGETADISVVTFGGTGGDELANINRWRGQLKLAPVEADALPSQVSNLAAAAGNFSVTDLTAEQAEPGKPLSRILGAWISRGNTVWFFKMMGPADLVGAQEQNFKGFLGSVAFTGPADPGRGAGAATGTNDLPKPLNAGPDLSNMATSPTLPTGEGVKAAEGSLLKWNAPASWTVKPPSSMRKGSYALGAGGGIDLSITAFPGDVGGTVANVNRWLGQVGLPSIDEADLPSYTTHVSANGLIFFVADTGSKDPANPQRIVAAVTSWQGDSWFFKMSGPSKLVADEKAEFLDFIQTVRKP
jgi:hypothetical protein